MYLFDKFIENLHYVYLIYSSTDNIQPKKINVTFEIVYAFVSSLGFTYWL